MKPASNSRSGTANRYDGSGWAGDGTRIPPGGSAQPQQSPYATSTPYGQKPQSNPYQQWNQGGTNQQQTRQPSLTDYMAPGSPMPSRSFSPPRSTDYPTRQPKIAPSISFAPGTSEEYKNQSYSNWSNSGWAGTQDRRPQSSPGAGTPQWGVQQMETQNGQYGVPRPADYGNDFRRPPSAPRAGDRSDPAYRDWRANQITDMRARKPAEQDAFEQRMYDQWSRGQGSGQAQPQQSPYAGSSPYGQQPAFSQPPMAPPGGAGNWGNRIQGRPDPFYMDGADPFGGWGGMDQFLGQRAAFVNNINQHRGRTASQGLPPTPMDFNQMWNQAGQMYQQGWQNPLQGLFG